MSTKITSSINVDDLFQAGVQRVNAIASKKVDKRAKIEELKDLRFHMLETHLHARVTQLYKLDAKRVSKLYRAELERSYGKDTDSSPNLVTRFSQFASGIMNPSKTTNKETIERELLEVRDALNQLNRLRDTMIEKFEKSLEPKVDDDDAKVDVADENEVESPPRAQPEVRETESEAHKRMMDMTFQTMLLETSEEGNNALLDALFRLGETSSVTMRGGEATLVYNNKTEIELETKVGRVKLILPKEVNISFDMGELIIRFEGELPQIKRGRIPLGKLQSIQFDGRENTMTFQTNKTSIALDISDVTRALGVPSMAD